jgi:glycosyltransferase involved in cell wall biosynthesis
MKEPTLRHNDILILSDYDPKRICGQTAHLNYLKAHFSITNNVILENRPRITDILKSDLIWFRSEKYFFQFVLLCKVLGKKMVYDLSSFPWLELQEARRSRLRITFSYFLYRFAAKNVTVRVISHAMKDYLTENTGMDPKNIWVFHIPVHFPKVRQKSPSGRKIQFMYLGSDKSWQGVQNLIHAFRKLENDSSCFLHCYGIQQTNGRNIHFHASVSHDRILEIIQKRMDVVIIPRNKNAITENVMPIKYIEAIYAGKFVLATDLKVLHEISNGKVIFMKNNEVDSIIRAVRRTVHKLRKQNR